MGTQQQKKSYTPKKLKHKMFTIPNKYVIITCLIIAFLDLVLNHFYRQSYYLYGLNKIAQMQNKSSLFVIFFFNCVSLLVDPIAVTLFVSVFFLVTKNKIRFLPIVFFFLLNTYFMGEFKALYEDPRPYWSNFRIRSLGWYCPHEYGNPSGHSWLVVIIYELVIYEYWGLGKYGINMIIPAVFSIMVPISRMYLGAHSANQITQGLLFGLLSLVLYRYVLYNWLRDIIVYFIKFSNNKQKQKKTLYTFIIINIVLVIIPMIVFTVDPDPTITRQQLNNVMNQCRIKQESMMRLNTGLMVLAALLNLGFGLIYGLSQTQDTYYYYYGKYSFLYYYKNQRLKKLFYRVVIDLTLLFSPIIILGTLAIVIKNIYVEYLLGCVSFLLGGFCFIAYSPKIQLKYNIIEIRTASQQL